MHAIAGWVVLAAVLVAALHARARVRSGRPYEGGVYRAAGVLVDLQVLLGFVVWADDRLWEAEGLLLPWLHPALAVLALLVTHFGIRRAANERWAAEAYAIAGRTLVFAVLLLGGAAGVAIQAAA